MSGYKIFILAFLELASFMLLWNIFNKKYENRLFKSTAIVVCASIVVVITSLIYPPIQFFTNYLFLFLSIKLAFKKNIKYLLLEFGLVLSIFGIMQLSLIVLIRLLSQSFMSKDIFTNYLMANFICMLLSLSAYKFTSYGRLFIFFKQESSKIYFFSVNLLIYIFIAKWVWNFKRLEFLDEIALYLIIPIIFILANLFFMEYHMKNKELKKSLEEYRKYSPVIAELLEDVRRRQHDFKNHLNTVYSLVLVADEQNLKEELTKYIASLNMSLENMEKILQIDNTVVAAIIYNKINEASKHDIEFSYNIQGECRFPFKDHELSEILNNLLDNAFEAAVNLEKGCKKVFLNLGYFEDNCIIEIGNTGSRVEAKDIGKIFNAGYTTKEGDNRGYGLYNVKKIVEGCNGKVQLSYENNYTVFSIKLK
ncbi:GHKL domain-containing protein [Clostridium swellfunianum]|uniref:sensor histidine kinase n=1 Tax=Clostridium swellfunianum TaxID=1367462 RepID=UPI00202EBA63|nr:GHKL domain-containing protein [Clostridium swellfunianum]MCM0647523.1 GHKL domain-containing protein [Clostridium swellfunianum]